MAEKFHDWKEFRFKAERELLDALAELAKQQNVSIGSLLRRFVKSGLFSAMGRSPFSDRTKVYPPPPNGHADGVK